MANSFVRLDDVIRLLDIYSGENYREYRTFLSLIKTDVLALTNYSFQPQEKDLKIEMEKLRAELKETQQRADDAEEMLDELYITSATTEGELKAYKHIMGLLLTNETP